jgi:hypothetical protein
MAGIFDRARSYWPENNIDIERLSTLIDEDVKWKSNEDNSFEGFMSKPKLDRISEPLIDDTMDFLRHSVTTEVYIRLKDGKIGANRFSVPSLFMIFRFERFTQEEAAEFISGIKSNDMWDSHFKRSIIERAVDLMRRNDSPDIDEATRLFVEML